MEIEKAIEVTDAVIVLLSNKSVTKEGYIQKEFKFALDIALEKPEGSVFIIPLRINRCSIPRKLKSYQYVDFFPKKLRDIAYKKILQSLIFRGNEIGIMPIRLIRTDNDVKNSVDERETILLKDYHPEPATFRVPRSHEVQYVGQAYVPDGVSQAALFVVESEQKDIIGKWIQIQNDKVSLGRANDNDIIFPNDSCVSRFHATIELHNNKWILQELLQIFGDEIDHYPINGTFINGQKIVAPVFIRTDDEIRLGPNLCLRFQSLV